MLFPPLTHALLPLLPLDARTLLTVGCRDRALWDAYRAMNPAARLLGIEADPATAAAAHGVLQVAVGDAEAEPLPFELPDGLDCVVYDGVLEHMGDPWALVEQHAKALNPDGMLLIRVANADYWRLAEALLRGTEAGSAPIKRLGRHGMEAAFERLGLSPCDVATTEDDSQEAGWFLQAMAPVLAALGIDPAEYEERARASHMIWRVRKEPRQPMQVLGSMLDPIGGVSDVRVVHPLRAVATDPSFHTEILSDAPPDGTEHDGLARIFVLHRPVLFGDQGLARLRSLTAAGFMVVTEFDDLPDIFGMMHRGGALSFYGAHAIQTSTASLAERLREYNPEIAIFPNAVPVLPAVENFADPSVLTVFFGALNRETDSSALVPALNEVAAIARDRLRFEVVHDRGFFQALQTPHKRFTPLCDYATYTQLLSRCEVSFMPLGDTRFTRAKSDLKFIEAAACRTVALASHVVYGNTIEDGRTGFLFRDAVELRSKLLRLIAMPPMAREMADAARAYVSEKRMLAYQVGARTAWYRSLWARRMELEDARRERMSRRR